VFFERHIGVAGNYEGNIFFYGSKTEKNYSKNDKNAWEKFIHRKESLVTERNSGWLKN
jgi:uncharacterized protein with NRDE domain